jgi:lipopolysaccharide/colanic/teichoic acid biosynthesis glycosyltransferase
METLRLPTNGAAYRIAKRFLDVLLSLAALPMIVLIGAIVAILVKISSPGPVFYRHTRIGLGGKTFSLWKFRTMTHQSDAVFYAHLASDADARNEWMCYRKLRRDPRITRIGRFLRRTNLDELPQILNVLLGQMSLVGPRPVMEEEIPRYGAGMSLYFAVLPGITGMWQVGGRGDVPYERRIALDVEYVSTWSLIRDVHVLAKTFRAVWSGSGAY